MNDNPKQLSIDQIIAILESGDFDHFIGIEESDHLEAKQKRPYDFASGVKSLAEFAKDIANISNSDFAAFIICGLTTQPSQTADTDEITEVNAFPENEFYSSEEIDALLKECVLPKPELIVKWYPSSSNPNMGLGTIFIEKQPDDKKYFLAKVIETNGEKIKGFFGIPVRKGAKTDWLPVSEVYALTKKTPTKMQDMFIQISAQLEEIKSQKNNNPASYNAEEALDNKIQETLDE